MTKVQSRRWFRVYKSLALLQDSAHKQGGISAYCKKSKKSWQVREYWMANFVWRKVVALAWFKATSAPTSNITPCLTPWQNPLLRTWQFHEVQVTGTLTHPVNWQGWCLFSHMAFVTFFLWTVDFLSMIPTIGMSSFH